MQKQNLLDMIPHVNKSVTWSINNDKNVEVVIKNTGVYNRIAQKIVKKPIISYIELDKIGSFIWVNINGERSIYDISQMIKEQFEEQVEPLYERLVVYFQMLKNQKFIEYTFEKSSVKRKDTVC